MGILHAEFKGSRYVPIDLARYTTANDRGMPRVHFIEMGYASKHILGIPHADHKRSGMSQLTERGIPQLTKGACLEIDLIEMGYDSKLILGHPTLRIQRADYTVKGTTLADNLSN